MKSLRLLRAQGGSAAAEMALLVPIFAVLLLGSLELGRYFYHEHKLLQGLRDAGRWAARQSFTAYPDCGLTIDDPDPIYTGSLQIARTGQVSGGTDRLPMWTDSDTEFTMTTICSVGTATSTYSGIYNGSSGGARLLRIDASLPYDAMFGLPGFGAWNISLNARHEAAVMGI